MTNSIQTGDKVEVSSNGFFLGTGIVVALQNSNVRMAHVQTFDGFRYAVEMDELTKIED